MSVWTDFDLDQPDGSTEDGVDVIAAIQANQHALWTFATMAAVKGMAFSVSGGTAAQPANIFFGNGTNVLKGAITWGTAGGAAGNFSSIVWSVSQDNGSTFTAVCTQGFTYDTNGNLTATSGAGGMLSFVAYLLGRLKALTTRVTTAEATLATLGDMALQNASSVAITGGSITGMIGTFLAVRETVVDLGSGTPANTFTIDFNAGGVFLCAPGNNFTIASTHNPPAGTAQKVVLEILDAAGYTVTLPTGWHWDADTPPTLTAGINLVTVYYRGHATAPTARLMLSCAGF